MPEYQEAAFIETTVKFLVKHPESVKVERKVDEMGVLITLDVHREDMGAIIGKEGMTAKALRTLLRVVGGLNAVRANLKINEPEGSSHPARPARKQEEAPLPSVSEMIGEDKQ